MSVSGGVLHFVAIETLIAVEFSYDLPMMGRKSIVIFYFCSEIFAIDTDTLF